MAETRHAGMDDYVEELGGTPREVVHGLEKLQRSARTYEAHIDEYRERYPEQFIAIHDGELVAHAATLEELIAALDAAGIPRRHGTIVRFVTAEDVTLILPDAAS